MIRRLILLAAAIPSIAGAVATTPVVRNSLGNAVEATPVLNVGADGEASNIGTRMFVESAAPLAASASMPTTTRDAGSTTPASLSYFGCSFNSDQPGTGATEDSTDGTTWFQSSTAALTAGTRLDLNVRLRARYNRCRYTNGATLQGSFRALSSFTSH